MVHAYLENSLQAACFRYFLPQNSIRIQIDSPNQSKDRPEVLRDRVEVLGCPLLQTYLLEQAGAFHLVVWVLAG